MILLAGLSLAFAVMAARGGVYPLDFHLIASSGERLMFAEWRRAFSDPAIQVGPLQALIWAAVVGLAQLTRIPVLPVFAALVHMSFVGALLLGARCISPEGEQRASRELALGLLFLAWGIPWKGFASGHPEEVWIGVLWIVIAYWCRGGRAAGAGALLAVAAAIKPWGLLGVPLLLLGSRKGAGIAVATAGVVSGAFYAPFWVWGEVAIFDYVWPITESAPLSFSWLDGFSWHMRFWQGVITVLAGVVLVCVGRTRGWPLWLLPVQIIALRLFLDPQNLTYYWLPVTTILFAAWIAGWSHFDAHLKLGLLVALYLVVVGTLVGGLTIWAPFAGVAGLSFVTWVVSSSPAADGRMPSWDDSGI